MVNKARLTYICLISVGLIGCKSVQPVLEESSSELASSTDKKRGWLSSSRMCTDTRKFNLVNALVLSNIAIEVYNDGPLGVDRAHQIGFGSRSDVMTHRRVAALFAIGSEYSKAVSRRTSGFLERSGSVNYWNLAQSVRSGGRNLAQVLVEAHGNNVLAAQNDLKAFLDSWGESPEFKSVGFQQWLATLPEDVRRPITPPANLRGGIGYYWNRIKKGSLLDAARQKVVPVKEGRCNVVDVDNQAVWLENNGVAVLAVRGTADVTDLITDVFAIPADIGRSEFGDIRVHSGFYCAALDIWERFLEPRLMKTPRSKPVYLTGHSLGGAVSSLLAYFMLTKGKKNNLAGVYTYGAPRAGNVSYKKHLEALARRSRVPMARFRNADDPVTLVPYGNEGPLPRFLKSGDRYQHAGTMLHLRDDVFGSYSFEVERETGTYSGSWGRGKASIRSSFPAISVYGAQSGQSSRWLERRPRDSRLRHQAKVLIRAKSLRELFLDGFSHPSMKYYGRIWWAYRAWQEANPGVSKRATCNALTVDLPYSREP